MSIHRIALAASVAAAAFAAPAFAEPPRYSVGFKLEDTSARVQATPSMIVRAGEPGAMAVSGATPTDRRGAYDLAATVKPFAQDLVDVEFRITTDSAPIVMRSRLKLGTEWYVAAGDMTILARVDPAPAR